MGSARQTTNSVGPVGESSRLACVSGNGRPGDLDQLL